jgi:F-type H+-transporting ATPase subunit gamma
MPNTQVLKSRVRSVKSTKQITKAMQLVAASKMRRAQESTKASAPYTEAARELLANLAQHASTKRHPLFAERPVNTRLLIVIASDRGLAGAFNSNLTRLYTRELQADKKSSVKNSTITVGRKAAQFVARLKDTTVLGSYENLPDQPGGSELQAILETTRNLFTEGKVDAVDVIYTDYVNAVRQEASIMRVLPAGAGLTETTPVTQDVTYEPSTSEVLDGVAYRLVTAQLYQALLDSRASEYSMRMMAMKNATDNATDLIEDLTLEMNKARQAAITQEISEISGGVEALND